MAKYGLIALMFTGVCTGCELGPVGSKLIVEVSNILLLSYATQIASAIQEAVAGIGVV